MSHCHCNYLTGILYTQLIFRKAVFISLEAVDANRLGTEWGNHRISYKSVCYRNPYSYVQFVPLNFIGARIGPLMLQFIWRLKMNQVNINIAQHMITTLSMCFLVFVNCWIITWNIIGATIILLDPTVWWPYGSTVQQSINAQNLHGKYNAYIEHTNKII